MQQALLGKYSRDHFAATEDLVRLSDPALTSMKELSEQVIHMVKENSEMLQHPEFMRVIERILHEGATALFVEVCKMKVSLPLHAYPKVVSLIIMNKDENLFRSVIVERRMLGIPEDQLVLLIQHALPDIVQEAAQDTQSQLTDELLTGIINYPHGPGLFAALQHLCKEDVLGLFRYINKWMYISLLFRESYPTQFKPSLSSLTSWASALCVAHLPTIAADPELSVQAEHLSLTLSRAQKAVNDIGVAMGAVRTILSDRNVVLDRLENHVVDLFEVHLPRKELRACRHRKKSTKSKKDKGKQKKDKQRKTKPKKSKGKA